MDMRGAALTYFAFMKRHKETRGVTSRNDVFRLYGTVGIVLNGLGNVLVMLPPPIPLVSSPCCVLPRDPSPCAASIVKHVEARTAHTGLGRAFVDHVFTDALVLCARCAVESTSQTALPSLRGET